MQPVNPLALNTPTAKLTAKTLTLCAQVITLSAIGVAFDAIVSPAAIATEAEQGEVIGPALDCDGDGLRDESRIDFDGDGIPDECVTGTEAVPEPPFEQTYAPSADSFYTQLPAVGWAARYQCADGLYDITLGRPAEDKLEYSTDGLTLTAPIVYDDIDPNLNQPLIVQDPQDGIRYSFEQAQDGEYYEYAIANYSGDIGLYIYQTGQQIVAAPCLLVTETGSEPSASASPATAPSANSRSSAALRERLF